MSSLSCVSGLCTFTRADTNVMSFNPIPLPELYPTLFPTFSTAGVPTESPTVFSNNEIGASDNGEPTLLSTSTVTTVVGGLRGGGADRTTASASLSSSDIVTLEPKATAPIAPWFDVANQDVLSDKVALSRGSLGGIFNARVEGDEYNTYYAPMGTTWALLPDGQTFEEARCNLQFCEWNSCFAQYDPANMLNKPGVLHLVDEDLFYNIMFTQWTEDNVGEYVHSSNTLPPMPMSSDELGGGFQYIRDEFPIAFDDSVRCPQCFPAKASPAVLTGPVDNTLRSVGITGLAASTGSSNATIVITAVAQERSQHYNMQNELPNAVGVGSSTVQLRRTSYLGELVPMVYTVFFTATNAAGSCRGQVSVCSPAEGFDCDMNSGYGFDATSTDYVPTGN